MAGKDASAQEQACSAELLPRRVKVSSQMQVRIPTAFYQHFGFGSEAICIPTEHGVEFRPVKSAPEVVDAVSKDLLKLGLSPEEFANELSRRVNLELGRRIAAEDMEIISEQIDASGLVRTQTDQIPTNHV